MPSRTASPPPLGAQRPRICWVPDFASSVGAEAVELCRMAGLNLDEWQEFVLGTSLNLRADGKFAAFEVGVEVSRQNGKGGILEARALAGMFLLGERLIIHSAHEFPTSLEAFRRLLFLIENTPEFDKRVKRISKSHGEEGIELNNGQRIRFRTRTKGGGRGFTGDCVILDEALELTETAVGALMPTVSARPNPQVWYTGSAVDQAIHDHGVAFARLRARGLEGGDQALAYFGWSPPVDDPSDVTPEMAEDPEVWAQSNPALGIRITAEHIAREQRSMAARTFAVERLGVGDWPDLDAAGALIPPELWKDCADPDSEVLNPVTFAYDVTPDRAWAAIAAAGKRSDGLAHIEIVEHNRGTAWLADRAFQLLRKHGTNDIRCDATGPAGSLIPELRALGINVIEISAKEHAQACGLIFDAITTGVLRHRSTPELDSAVRGAVTRSLGEAWAWSRKNSAVDISPLVACTIAHWGGAVKTTSIYESEEATI